MSLKRILLEKNINDPFIKNITDKLEDNFDLSILDDHPLLHERFGVYVYSINNTNKIIRIGKGDYSKVKNIVGINFENVSELYYHNIVDRNYLVSVMEQCFPLDGMNKEVIERIYTYDGLLNYFITEEDYTDDYYMAEILDNDDIDYIDDAINIVKQVHNGYNELKKYGIEHGDLHVDNIMQTRSTIKLIDYF